MGWAVGDNSQGRDIGYGVPAWCDHPDCNEEIDRGLSYACGGFHDGDEHGCGMYFCGNHLGYAYTPDGLDDLLDQNGKNFPQMCERCIEQAQHPDRDVRPFQAKPNHPEWVNHKLTHHSWAQWRDEHPGQVEAMRKEVNRGSYAIPGVAPAGG